MTSVVAPATPKIVGKALYLELVANPALSADQRRTACGWQHEGTKQIILFPEYQDDTGRIHQARFLTRIVSTHTPRSQWDFSYPRNPKPISEMELDSSNDYFMWESYSTSEWAELPMVAKVESKKLALDLYLRGEMLGTYYSGEGDERKSITTQAWVIRDSKPFAVELTDEDYADLHDRSKTPQAVIRRINKVRESISTFPSKLG